VAYNPPYRLIIFREAQRKSAACAGFANLNLPIDAKKHKIPDRGPLRYQLHAQPNLHGSASAPKSAATRDRSKNSIANYTSIHASQARPPGEESLSSSSRHPHQLADSTARNLDTNSKSIQVLCHKSLMAPFHNALPFFTTRTQPLRSKYQPRSR
jgi:hypothetical protein